MGGYAGNKIFQLVIFAEVGERTFSGNCLDAANA
jgi:hypothetical protein